MSKIKLVHLLKEYLKEIKHKHKVKQEMNVYAQKMDKSLEKLKTLMRKDGYEV